MRGRGQIDRGIEGDERMLRVRGARGRSSAGEGSARSAPGEAAFIETVTRRRNAATRSGEMKMVRSNAKVALSAAPALPKFRSALSCVTS